MSKDTPVTKSGINKTTNTNRIQRKKGSTNHQPYEDYINVIINKQEKDYLERLASLLSKMQVNNDSKLKLLPDKSMSSLAKMALGMLTNVYLTQVLIQSEVAKSLPDKDALNEFVAFRRDYMNFPVDKQILDLKRVGIVK
jgi:type III secretory pathway component EscR